MKPFHSKDAMKKKSITKLKKLTRLNLVVTAAA